MKALILANGDPPSVELAQRLVREHDLFLVTDGAAHHAEDLHVTPDVICGDFDSIDLAAARRAFPHAEVVPTPDQNAADLEKALLIALTRGAGGITIAGAGGGRIDHHLASFALLLRYGREAALSIVDDRAEVRAVSGTFQFRAQPGETVSLIALEAGVCVSISGVNWNLSEATLAPGTLGVSNKALGGLVTLVVHFGTVLLCHLTTVEPRQS